MRPSAKARIDKAIEFAGDLANKQVENPFEGSVNSLAAWLAIRELRQMSAVNAETKLEFCSDKNQQVAAIDSDLQNIVLAIQGMSVLVCLPDTR